MVRRKYAITSDEWQVKSIVMCTVYALHGHRVHRHFGVRSHTNARPKLSVLIHSVVLWMYSSTHTHTHTHTSHHSGRFDVTGNDFFLHSISLTDTRYIAPLSCRSMRYCRRLVSTRVYGLSSSMRALRTKAKCHKYREYMCIYKMIFAVFRQ